MKRSLLFWVMCLTFLGSVNLSWTQANNSTKDTLKYVQLTGIVVNDSLQRLPFTAIYDLNTQRGVISDYYGYFAMVVHPGDTIQFSYIGFKQKSYVVPEPDSTNSLSIVSVLQSDTLMSKPVEVYPWPSREEFADAFINLEIDDDAINRAKERLSPQEMAFVYGTLGSDASLSYKAQTQQYMNQVYYRNQQAPNNLLNPVAWNNFLKSLNNGDMKISQ